MIDKDKKNETHMK